MKTDLATSIIVAIASIVVAYLAVNFLMPGLQDVSFKTIDTSVSSALTDPDVEIFNFRAVNPTVEVYVGQCTEYNEKGECIDDTFEAENESETPGEEENGNSN